MRMSAGMSRSKDVTSQSNRRQTLPTEPVPEESSNTRIYTITGGFVFLFLLVWLLVFSLGFRLRRIFGAVVVDVQHTYLVLNHVALRIILEDGSPSGVLLLHVHDLLSI